MRRYFTNLFLTIGLAAGAATQAPAYAQDVAAAPKAAAASRVLGEVTAIDPAANQLTLKNDQGQSETVPFNERTSYLRAKPGSTSLSDAERITLADVGVGDRVLARVRKSADGAALPAATIVVMSKAALVEKAQKSAQEWRTRGAAGKVAALDPAARTYTIQVQTPAGLKPMVVNTTEKTVYRRYAPDSTRFADAKPSRFDEVKVGDNLRVLGNKNADGTAIDAEESISGTFRNIAGTIVSVDAAGNSFVLKDLASKQNLTVKLNADSTLKKLPPNMAMMMAHTRQGGNGAGAANPGGAPAPAGGQPARTAGAGAPGAPAGMGAGMARGNFDFNSLMERMPAVTLAELKPGDALILSSTSGDPKQVTAITLIAGVEPLLTASPSGQSVLNGSWNLDIAAPQ